MSAIVNDCLSVTQTAGAALDVHRSLLLPLGLRRSSYQLPFTDTARIVSPVVNSCPFLASMTAEGTRPHLSVN